MVGYLYRYIEKNISDDLKRKMVFVGRPRQSGKTTMAKKLCNEAGFDTKKRYLNWDAAEISANRSTTLRFAFLTCKPHKYHLRMILI